MFVTSSTCAVNREREGRACRRKRNGPGPSTRAVPSAAPSGRLLFAAGRRRPSFIRGHVAGASLRGGPRRVQAARLARDARAVTTSALPVESQYVPACAVTSSGRAGARGHDGQWPSPRADVSSGGLPCARAHARQRIRPVGPAARTKVPLRRNIPGLAPLAQRSSPQHNTRIDVGQGEPRFFVRAAPSIELRRSPFAVRRAPREPSRYFVAVAPSLRSAASVYDTSHGSFAKSPPTSAS